MKTVILITDKSVTFENLKDTIGKNFQCSLVLNNRITVENESEHLFIDADDNMKEDYDEPDIKESDSHFYSVLYNSDEFAKQVLNKLVEFQILIDDDDGTILPIKSFLSQM